MCCGSVIGQPATAPVDPPAPGPDKVERDPVKIAAAERAALPQDSRLRKWIGQWEGYLKDRKLPPKPALEDLEALLAREQHTARTLSELGRAAALAGDKTLSNAYRQAAMAEARKQFADNQRNAEDDAEAVKSLRNLGRTFLRDLKDFEAARDVFAEVKDWEAPGTAKARLTARWHAESIYELSREQRQLAPTAAKLLSDILAAQWKEPIGQYELGDINWGIGSCWYCAGQFDQAIPHFRKAFDIKGAHYYTPLAAQYLVSSLAHLGRAAEAQKMADELAKDDRLKPEQVQRIRAAVQPQYQSGF